MQNFHITFSYPWLLFLLIPALFLVFFPYFRTAKRYRRNRNRITSVVLGTVVMILSVFVLSGMKFRYSIPTEKNEVILLVDMSYSTEEAKENRDAFVQDAIDSCGPEFSVGIITFGFDQVYASEISNEIDDTYGNYLVAELPNETASDLASALSYARECLKSPESAKIVLVTDGMETDGSAMSVIRSLTAEGIKLDAYQLSTRTYGNEIQLTDVTFPDYNIALGDEFKITLSYKSTFDGTVALTVFDNGKGGDPQRIQIVAGEQKILLRHSFSEYGLHELSFRFDDPYVVSGSSSGSTKADIVDNNIYNSYINLIKYDKILVIEGVESESDRLKAVLEEKMLPTDDPDAEQINEYTVTVVQAQNAEKMPSTLDELRRYDEVIFSNVAAADLPEGFDKLLKSYVYDYGGGLFTVGGKEPNSPDNDPDAHAYDRLDLKDTLLQDILPVQAIDYTPPVAVIFILDRSGSMSGILEDAKWGTRSAVEALTERDYCGVMTLETDYHEELQITPMTQLSKIRAAIDSIVVGGGTNYTPAIKRAGSALEAMTNVERKHIVVVSDGQPGDELVDFGSSIDHCISEGITFSFFTFGAGTDKMVALDSMFEGNESFKHTRISNFQEIQYYMREDLKTDAIKEVVYEPYTPTIRTYTPALSGISQENLPQLKGFYGTKIKEGATTVLTAKYVPIYAQWNYGRGRVGSFMCDLSGSWSEEFIEDEYGKKFIYNVINNLFPTESVRPNEIDASFRQDNYTTYMSIYTTLEENQTLGVSIANPTAGEDAVLSYTLTAADNYSRQSFKTMESGIYTVTLQKKAENGDVLAESTFYQSFSYSAEYDAFRSSYDTLAFLTDLTGTGGGAVVEDAGEIYEDLITGIERTYDPRLVFIIVAIVLFLLDVAVRKFKFKWIHELVADRKAKSAARKK